AVTTPFYIFFAWLSDRIGRKRIMLFGYLLVLVSLFPGFKMLTEAVNPALAAAAMHAPVTVVASPADCSFQFDPVGKAQFTTS
ncbi:MFS transporter, partial [Klebsiella pneumoniae]|nr:MFS transporter [Klebsiella pneumoniae]